MSYFKKTDGSVNTATLDGATSETIDDETTLVISSQYDCVMLQDYDTGKWAIL
jgi:hypothetical protein